MKNILSLKTVSCEEITKFAMLLSPNPPFMITAPPVAAKSDDDPAMTLILPPSAFCDSPTSKFIFPANPADPVPVES